MQKKKYPNIIVNIRPTTPFRNHKMIDKAINIFSKNIKKYTSLRSVERCPRRLKSLFVEKNIAKSIIRNNSMDDINFPRQKFQKTYYAMAM